MSKERFLTVMVPIKDSDCEATVYDSIESLVADVPADIDNVNKIYKLEDGTYMRLWLNPATEQYEYHAVVDREFPYLGKPLEIFDFTYDATRMGTAPTISAQNVMWFAEKDDNGEDITLENLWSTQECHVFFNKEKFYLKQIPTSRKSNEDARYKYDIDFISNRYVLENVYLYDVVSPFISESPISESSSFSFYGDINELAKRINASLIRSGLSTLTRKYVPYPNRTEIVPYLDYEQWNRINVNPHSLIGPVFINIGEMNFFRTTIYNALSADYNRYLMQYVYENDNGEYTLTGYQCRIGKDKKGEVSSSDEKLISFENNTIHEALQQFKDTFELQYYIANEKDGSGNFTGNTLIWVADCEHDFADWDDDNDDYVRDNDGIPTTDNPFDYGSTDALLSKEKANTTEKIVTRITGVGSSENIPWHYPNPNPDGWIKPLFTRNGEEQQGVTIDYPTDEGSTVADSVRYERYLKNRIGNAIKRGSVKEVFFENDYYLYDGSEPPTPTNYMPVKRRYQISTIGIAYPRMTLELYYNQSESGCNRLIASLHNGNLAMGDYDSSETYQEPTAFQKMFSERDGKTLMPLAAASYHFLDVTYRVPLSALPYSRRYDYEGYRYPSQKITKIEVEGTSYSVEVYIGENFYDVPDLIPYVEYDTVGQTLGEIKGAGYSTDGTSNGKVSPIPRVKNKKYKDVESETIYNCYDGDSCEWNSDAHKNAFSANPKMDQYEWFATFVDMRIRIHANDGWYIGNEKIELEDYGVGEPTQNGSTVTTDIFDAIEFQRVKYVTPQPNLMPEVYIKTDGERRFYNAHNYWDKDNETLYNGTADVAVGEVQVQSKVRNPIYKGKETEDDSKHYEFENEYMKSLPHEHIENFNDIKPSIVEQTNIMKVSVTEEQFNASKTSFYTLEDGDFVQCTASSVYDSETQYYAMLRIDVVEEFAYDETDNDEVWESYDDGNVQGEYKHPYFFARLRPLGFNLFDLALQDDMVISMTTGNCGACNFKIGVDEKSKKNPVQLWEYDVYRGEWADKEKVYGKNDLRRYVDLSGLYFDTDGTEGGYVSVVKHLNIEVGAKPKSNAAPSVPVFETYVYSASEVKSGMVGGVKQDNKTHFEGDVVTHGRYIESQQDTSEEYVWVALMKDTDTYGTLMPAALPYYDNHTFDIYIDPKGINYTDRATGDTFVFTEEDADKFVLLNIRMPQVYLRRAEHELSRRLVKHMYDNNYQKFNFPIDFSRIFLAQNNEIENNLNENSVLYVNFNGRTFRQYAKHYTYTMRRDQVLPEIKVDMNDELSVSRNFKEKQIDVIRENNSKVFNSVNKMISQTEKKIYSRTVGTNDYSHISEVKKVDN